LEQPHQFEAFEALTKVDFRDPSAANGNLVGIRKRMSKTTYERVLRYLAETPDPDTATIFLDRLLEATRDQRVTGISRSNAQMHALCLLFGSSPWLGETLIQNPDILKRLSNRAQLQRALSTEEFLEEFARMRTRFGEGDLSASLARFRKREYVRIVVRDLLGIAELAEVTEEISSLADALLEEALRQVGAELAREYGAPQWIDENGRHRDAVCAIISLGKLGGRELNYSSDVDLLFLHDVGCEPTDAATMNRAYFALLAERITGLLSRPTAEGQVFRIDLRLRPYGREGQLAVTLPHAIRYYNHIAEDWELQAMIKARHSAGEPSLSRQFISAIANSVYRPDVNFAAVKTALQMRQRFDKRATVTRSKEHSIDVKLDKGGIRDIEFLVQCLQRTYGGEEGWLRSRGTLFTLQNLHDKGHISGRDFQVLSKTYEFLRRVEHSLQLRYGQQNHQIPSGEPELHILAKSFSTGVKPLRSPQQFVAEVRARMSEVAGLYQQVVYLEKSSQSLSVPELSAEPSTPAESSYSRAMRRLAVDAPGMFARIAAGKLSQHGRKNLARFLNACATTPERFAAMLQAQDVTERALKILEYSDFITDLLVRHPGEVVWLRNEPDSDRASTPQGGPDPGTLRKHFRRAVIAANAEDLFERSVIWRVLEENTAAADQALSDAVLMTQIPGDFAVMAVGRLGSREFDVLSDADLLFVAAESIQLDECRRISERLMEILTAYTKEGTIFPVDTRLRPQGGQGEFVSTPTRLAHYFLREAKPWEAISYLRLRYVAGSRDIALRALHAVHAGTAAIGSSQEFLRELREMRERLEVSDTNPNFATGPGGLFDIDFLVGGLQAQHGLSSRGNLRDRIKAVCGAGLLGPDIGQELTANAEFLRSLEHYIRLVTGRPQKWLPAGEHARSALEELMTRHDNLNHRKDLAVRLESVLRRNREISARYLFN
jgi:glutamate-ammonia-ligase adenylyltransferase